MHRTTVPHSYIHMHTYIYIYIYIYTQILSLRTLSESRRSECTVLQDRIRDRDVQIESLENDLASLSNQITTATAGGRNTPRWTHESSDFIPIAQLHENNSLAATNTDGFNHTLQLDGDSRLKTGDVGSCITRDGTQTDSAFSNSQIEKLKNELSDALRAQTDAELRAGMYACVCVCVCVCVCAHVCMYVFVFSV
jgi:hypothetical protein